MSLIIHINHLSISNETNSHPSSSFNQIKSLNIYIESLSLLCQINPYIIITISTILKIYVVFSFIHSLNYVYLIQITTQSSNDTNQRTIIDLILAIRFNFFLLIGKLIAIISKVHNALFNSNKIIN